MGIDSNKLFDRISDVILKTCIASEPFMLDSNAKCIKTYYSAPEHKNSFFELYGFDILIDQDLKPWVLEVNVCPSLNSSSPLDKKIKTALISDILHLVGVPLWDKSRKRNTCRNINLHEIASIISPVHR
jgi:tubulin polyglutamylase TTLL4